ncbi:MAG: ABC transporter permease [Acidobacteriota bacterium]|nr:ABC transporter permease [Acidobacteriota bacterium]
MNWMQRVFGRRRVYGDLSEEIRAHLHEKAEELVASGMPREEAEHAARREFGNIRLTEQDAREVWRWPRLENFIIDTRYALRTLRKSPGFTTIAILTLALGLAANTAIFSVINGVLLQPLEYPHPNQLVALQLFVPTLASKFPMIPINPAAYQAWAHGAKSLAGIGVVEVGDTMNLTGSGEPALLSADAITPDLFNVLGVKLMLGRNFSPDSDQPGRNHEVILTNALWQTRFHSDPNIVGRAIALNGSPYTIVGVLLASLHFPQGSQLIPVVGPTPDPELFVPVAWETADLAPDAGFGLGAIARLKTGVGRAQAVAELNVILSRKFGSEKFLPNPKVVMLPLRDMIVRSSERGLWLLFAAVLAVLLIICANLASLVLTRATGREHEAAIRSALGASRGRLLGQTMTETLALGLVGGALGLVLAHWALWALVALAPTSLPRLHSVRLDGAVLGFTLGMSLAAGLLAGLFGACRMARANPQDALRSASARSTDREAGLRTREILVGLETALGTILLLAAGLLLASFTKIEKSPKGFVVEHVLTVNLQLPATQYARKEQRSEFWHRVLASTSALPGVESSAVTDWLPLGGEMNDDPVNLPGDTRPEAERPFATYRYVSPAYFKALGIPLLRGRELTRADAGTGAVVISADAANTIWPGINPIGQKFDVSPGPALRVVGVVGDTRSVSLFKAPAPMVYSLYGGGLAGSLILRARLPATAVASELRGAVWSVDSGVAVPPIRSMGQIVSTSLAPRRFETLLTSLFAAAALLLACLGIYGVVSYSVARRTHEIGIRMALGAQRSDVLGRVMGRALMPAMLGLGAGIIVSLGLTHLLSSLLYGVKPTDPLTFGAVPLILAAVILLAGYVPARRAMRVDPATALRHE